VSSERGAGACGLSPRLAGDHLRQGDIIERGELRQQVVGLVDEADGGQAYAGALSVRELGAVAAPRSRMRPAVGMFQQAGRMQQRRLAGA
jgi:hypothetical protein